MVVYCVYVVMCWRARRHLRVHWGRGAIVEGSLHEISFISSQRIFPVSFMIQDALRKEGQLVCCTEERC